MSFRKLKEEYSDYKGGLLLIDEADAGLFPTAQVNLLNMLEKECKELNLQVVMTSHSPVLIEYAHEKSQKLRKSYKTIYLSNSYGDVQVMNERKGDTMTIHSNDGLSGQTKQPKLSQSPSPRPYTPDICLVFADVKTYDREAEPKRRRLL